MGLPFPSPTNAYKADVQYFVPPRPVVEEPTRTALAETLRQITVWYSTICVGERCLIVH